MQHTLVRLSVAFAMLFATLAAAPSVARGGTPGKWTAISPPTKSTTSAGILRTPDGTLHVAWVLHSNQKYSLEYTNLSTGGTVLGMGVTIPNWGNFADNPRLVPHGNGLRLVFSGVQNTAPGNPFNSGALYTATSANGTSWAVGSGGLSEGGLAYANLGIAATLEKDGTPVAAFAKDGIHYHVGIDTHIPATAPDQIIKAKTGAALENPTLVRASDGSVWIGWFSKFASDQGYWVEQILPKRLPAVKVPSGGALNLADNEPWQQTPLVARPTGGVFMAYCTPSATANCAHVNLWKEGTPTPKIVPGTSTGHAARVTLVTAPSGRLWIAWYDTDKNQVHAVRTNRAATAFGPVLTLPAPPDTYTTTVLEAEGSPGQLDIVANSTASTAPYSVRWWHAQIFQQLDVTATPKTFSHAKSTQVTFKVTDASDPVAGAKVSVLGKTATTNAAGIAKITFPAGTATGKHAVTAKAPDYAPGKTQITVS